MRVVNIDVAIGPQSLCGDVAGMERGEVLKIREKLTQDRANGDTLMTNQVYTQGVYQEDKATPSAVL